MDKIIFIWPDTLLPGKSSLLRNISAKMHPTAHISTAVECSGNTYRSSGALEQVSKHFYKFLPVWKGSDMLCHVETMFFCFFNVVFHSQFRHSKISDSKCAVAIDQKIRRLQVAMCDSGRVKVLKHEIFF